MDDQHDKPSGFRVTDRRRFGEGGERREAGEGAEGETPPAPEVPPARREDPGEPVTFSTFVLGLSTQAIYNLGEIPNPVTGETERDLVAAKHLIDMLGILSEKTRNNLDQNEEHLLDSVLYDLRMRYVELTHGSKKEEQ